MRLRRGSDSIESIGIWGYSTNGLHDGFSYAGYKTVKALNALGIDTWWEYEESPVAISFKQPHHYGGVESQFRIGYTPWESTEVPQKWINIINSQDLFWTPSNWCKEVFENAGVKIPVVVVRHGLDGDEFTLSKREIKDYMIFFHMGEPADRKNGQMVFDAFVKVFKGNSNVKLFYKANGWLQCRWRNGDEIIGPVTNHPQVESYKGILSITDLNVMLHSLHCLVYPSNSEGYGLIPLQAMGTGMPTILPNYSGMSEFAEFGINVDYTVGSSGHGYHIGEWCWPSFDDLCDKMLYVYENYDEVSSKAFENANLIRRKFDWENLIQEAVVDLESKL